MHERSSGQSKPNIEVIIGEHRCNHERFGIRWVVRSPWAKQPHDLSILIATVCNQCGMFWGYPRALILADNEITPRPISAVATDGGIGVMLIGRIQHAPGCSRPDPMLDASLHLLRHLPTSEPPPPGTLRGMSFQGRCEECRVPLYFPDAHRLEPEAWKTPPEAWAGAICNPLRDRVVVMVGETIFRERTRPPESLPTPPAPPEEPSR